MEAESYEEAAQRVNLRMDDPPGSVYSVLSHVGPSPALTVTIGSI